MKSCGQQDRGSPQKKFSRDFTMVGNPDYRTALCTGLEKIILRRVHSEKCYQKIKQERNIIHVSSYVFEIIYIYIYMKNNIFKK